VASHRTWLGTALPLVRWSDLVMCDCRKDLESRLLERFIEQKPGTEHKAQLSGYGFVFSADNTMTMRGCMPAEMSYMHTLKNGKVKLKKLVQNMLFTFCPFCGQRYDFEPEVKEQEVDAEKTRTLPCPLN
jgi:hypothetical protein